MAGMSLDEIKALIKTKVELSLETVVGERIKEDLAQKADTVVYDAYSPKRYERRFTLNNEGSYPVEKSGEMEITVTPKAPFNRLYGGLNYGDDLPGLMNYGAGWNGHFFDYGTPNPRPYIDQTVDEWDGGKFKEVLAGALRARGLNVK